MRNGAVIRLIGSDLARMLGVLALLLLNIAHQPPALAVQGPALVVQSVAVFCGGAPDGSAPRKSCDACRLAAGLDVPAGPSPVCAMADYLRFSPLPARNRLRAVANLQNGFLVRAPPLV